MNLGWSIFKSIVTIAILVVAILNANSSFQYLVLAGIGFIYGAVDFGVSSIQQTLSEKAMTDLGMRTSMAQNIPGFKEDINFEKAWEDIEIGNTKVKDASTIFCIKSITNILVTAGCLYMVFLSV